MKCKKSGKKSTKKYASGGEVMSPRKAMAMKGLGGCKVRGHK
jgi:hypothetical protein